MIKNTTTTKESSSILNQHSKIDAPNMAEQDGTHFINVDIRSKSQLGKRLSMQYSKSFNTIIGRVISIRTFANAITIPGFPPELLNKFKPTKEDLARIPKEGTKVPNYWALIAYAFTEMVKQDSALKDMLIKNDLPFVAVEERVTDFFGTPFPVSRPNYKLGKYIAIIRLVSKLLKENKFTDENIKAFIVDCKDVPEVDILTDIAWPVKTAKPETKPEEKPEVPNVPEFQPEEQDEQEDSAEASEEVEETTDTVEPQPTESTEQA